MNEISFQTKKLHELALFKCEKNGKAPQTYNGYKGAILDFDIEGALMNGYNIGLPMEPNQLIGIDMDVDASKNYNGSKTIEDLEKELGPLPRTYTQQTPRVGMHKVYLATDIDDPIGKIGKDVDVKHNGYLLLASSSINSNYYQAIDGVTEDGKLYFSELPQKWVNYLNKNNKINTKQIAHKVQAQRKVYTGADIDKMMKRCRFLAFCAEEENASCLPEPMWHTMVSVLAQVEGSDELIHTLSEPYHRYSFEETQKKIDCAKKFGFSQTCGYISANYPEACKNCKSAINERME